MVKRVIVIFFMIASYSMFSQNWLTDFEKAKNIAKDNNQKILLVFSGSDWCAPCIKLEKEIWQSKEFKDFSKSNFVLLRADFPRRKNNTLSLEQQERNKILAEKYNKNGYFPLVVVLDSNGDILGVTGYKKLKPTDYINLLASF